MCLWSLQLRHKGTGTRIQLCSLLVHIAVGEERNVWAEGDMLRRLLDQQKEKNQRQRERIKKLKAKLEANDEVIKSVSSAALAARIVRTASAPDTNACTEPMRASLVCRRTTPTHPAKITRTPLCREPAKFSSAGLSLLLLFLLLRGGWSFV